RLYRGLLRVVCGLSLEPPVAWLGWRAACRRGIARWLFGVRVQDVECAFRLFRRSIFARIPIQSHRAFAQPEIRAKANFLGCWMTEVPVPHRPRPGAVEPGWTFAEVYRLLAHADFGPAVLPSEGQGPAATTEPAVAPPKEGDTVAPPP